MKFWLFFNNFFNNKFPNSGNTKIGISMPFFIFCPFRSNYSQIWMPHPKSWIWNCDVTSKCGTPYFLLPTWYVPHLLMGIFRSNQQAQKWKFLEKKKLSPSPSFFQAQLASSCSGSFLASLQAVDSISSQPMV